MALTIGPVRRHRWKHLRLLALAFITMLCATVCSVAAERQQELPVHGRRPAVDLQTARGLNQLSVAKVPTKIIASPPSPRPSLHTSTPPPATTTPFTSSPPSLQPLATDDALPILDTPPPRKNGSAVHPLPATPSSVPNATKPPAARDPWRDAVWRRSHASSKRLSLLGPLCVFIPANGHDEKHLKEVEAVLEAWGDASTLLFTENPIVMERTEEVATRNGIARALVEMEEWKSWQRDLVLAHANLRRRGATNESLRGRGQLSIPLFYWISQLVKSNHSLVQNCKWFMKCDTDTYLRRGLLETTVLARYDPELPYHVGVPLRFNTRPFHHTLRDINFQYNIGGPGYTFSRGLMRMVNVDECIESMTRDPVLLIHDDVATGYCATYHARRSMRENVGPCFTSSLHQTVTSLITASQAAPPKAGDVDCLRCFVALHPVRPASMQALAKMDAADARLSMNTSTCPSVGSQCDLSLMLGSKSTVGDAVRLPPPLDGVAKYWHNVQIWQLPVSERMIAGQAKELIDTWKRE